MLDLVVRIPGALRTPLAVVSYRRRPAAAASSAATNLHEPSLGLRWVKHDALTIPDPNPSLIGPGMPQLVKSGELQPGAAAGEESRQIPPPPAPPTDCGRPIWK